MTAIGTDNHIHYDHSFIFVINASNKYSIAIADWLFSNKYDGRLVYSQWKLSLLLFYEAFESIENPNYPIDTHRYYCFIIFFQSIWL